MASDEQIAAVLMDLAERRGPGASFCPSEAARALAADGKTDWRPLMSDVRRVAAGLPLLATQRGRPVDPVTTSGPIRLTLAPKADPLR